MKVVASNSLQARLESAAPTVDEFDGERDQARAELEEFISMHSDLGENLQSERKRGGLQNKWPLIYAGRTR